MQLSPDEQKKLKETCCQFHLPPPPLTNCIAQGCARTTPLKTVAKLGGLALRLGPLFPDGAELGADGRLQNDPVHEIFEAGAGLGVGYARAGLHRPEAAAQHVLVAVHLRAFPGVDEL